LNARATDLRGGLLIGAGDYTDRMTWLVRRIDKCGLVPVPGPEDGPIQAIVLRDVSDFALRVAGFGNSGGIYNVTSEAVRFDDLLSAIQTVAASDARPVWSDFSPHVSAGPQPWSDLPLILPDDPATEHMMNVSIDKAKAAGLRHRARAVTFREILGSDRG
jgi:2'-hydroxyisoflavone reductase